MSRINLPEGPLDERARMLSMRPELGAAVDAFTTIDRDHSILPVRVREAARIRIAHVNGCEICANARVADLEAWGLDENFYADVDDPELRGRYGPQEQLAIGFAERFAEGKDAFDDGFWAELRSVFTDEEIVDLSILCAKWLGLGRTTRCSTLRVPVQFRSTHAEELGKPAAAVQARPAP